MAESNKAATSEAVQKTRLKQKRLRLRRVDITLDQAHTKMFNELVSQQDGYVTKHVMQEALSLYYASKLLASA